MSRSDFLRPMLLALATLTLAQTSNAQEDQTEPKGASTLQEVVVTAQKREENLSHFAGALVAVTGENLSENGVTDLRNLQTVVNGVMFSTNGTIVSPSIRGIGSTQYSPLGGPSVGFNLDGIPVDGMIAPNAAFYDVDRVEVLKGPQGTLYGRNATAGVVNVVTHRPTLGEFGGTVSLEAGNYDATRVEGAVNIPLNDVVALRVSGMREKHHGYMTNGYDDADDYAGRIQLLIKPIDAVSLLLAADYFHQGGTGVADVPLPLGSRDTNSAHPFEQMYYPNLEDAYVNNYILGTHAELTADLGFATLDLLPAFHDFSRDTVSYQGSFRGYARDVSRQTSVEARLSNSVHAFDWLVGAYYFHDNHPYTADYLNPTSCIGTALTRFADGDCLTINGSRANVPQDSRAGFAQITYHVTDQFRLTGGIRYTHDKRQVAPNTDYTLDAFPGGPPVVFGSPFPIQPPPSLTNPLVSTITENAGVTFSNTSFKVGAEYDLGTSSLVYANIATGYKAGGINDGNATVYDPEKLTSYELGFRTTLLDTVRVHLNGFYWDYKDHQEAGVYFVPPFGILYQVTDIPKGKIAGSDLEVRWQPTSADSVNAALSYLYSDTGPFSLPTGIQSATGHPYINSPRWTFNLGYDHQFLFGDWKLVPNVMTHVVSNYNTDFRFSDTTRQSGYMKTDLNLLFGPQNGRWSLAAYVLNLEDKAVIVSAQAAPGPGAPQYWGFLSDPRTFGLRANVNF